MKEEQRAREVLVEHIGINELTPTQMRVIARALQSFADEARLAEQERCADLIESMDSAGLSRLEIATAIRKPQS